MFPQSDFDVLLHAIDNRTAKVGVVGVGYIGLPTAAVLASVGFKIVGIDVDAEKISALNKGECYIDEPGLPRLVASMVRRNLFQGSTDYRSLRDCDIILFCTQTPLLENSEPDLSIIFGAVNLAREHSSPPLLVICESTVPPGTTRSIADVFLKDGVYQLDENLWVSHCPERVLPGQVIKEFTENPRVIGGLTRSAGVLARKLYGSFVSSDKLLETDSRISEFAKLAENTFRDVNIALANELAMCADALALDVTEAISLANLHPRVNIHSPGLGVGGHCIPKDPLLLFHSIVGDYRPKLIPTARTVNEDMPGYAAARLKQTLGEKDLHAKKIVILGTAFKENVDDTRRSPTKAIVEELVRTGAEVRTHDTRSDERFGVPDAGSIAEAVEWAEVVILAVAHSEYLVELPGLDFQEKIFLDGRNAFSPKSLKAKTYLGIGRPISIGPEE